MFRNKGVLQQGGVNMNSEDGGMNEESDGEYKTAFRINFFRDCYGNYSQKSPVCIFCEWGLDCEKKAIARNQGVQK
jgi:hypothetical protein